MRVCGAMIGLVFAAMAASAETSGSACDKIYPLVKGALAAKGVPAEQVPGLEDLNCAAAPAQAHSVLLKDAKWDAERLAFRFRLACAEAHPCLPFLVMARVAPAKAAVIRDKLQTGKKDHKKVFSPARMLVLPGRRATLLVERDGMRIRAAVTCLQRGGRGEVVRVRLKDSGQLFRARVVGTDQVRLF